MSCELTHLDGSYVLGALSPGERQDFERHLADCAECARAVRELAGLPGLLGRVDLETLESPPPDVPVPETLLPALVHEVRRSQRRRVLVTAGVAAAAAVAVVVGGFATLGVAGHDRSPDAAPPGVSASAPVAQPMVPVGTGPVTANLALEALPWGTRLDLTCTYAPDSYRGVQPRSATYALIVRTRDGRTEQVATWRALPGRTLRLAASTAAGRADIASVEVRTADGHPVLKLTT